MKYQQLVVMPASVQDWLDHELEVRGIDAVVYTRYILSILQQDNSLVDRELLSGVTTRNLKKSPGSKEKSKLSADRVKFLSCEEMKKSAAIECLMSVSEQKYGIEKLVDELCDRLKNIQGNGTIGNELSNEVSKETRSAINISSLTSSSPQEQVENYFMAFPALSGSTEPSVEPKPQNFPENKSSSSKYVWENSKNLTTSAGTADQSDREEQDEKKFSNKINDLDEEIVESVEKKTNFLDHIRNDLNVGDLKSDVDTTVCTLIEDDLAWTKNNKIADIELAVKKFSLGDTAKKNDCILNENEMNLRREKRMKEKKESLENEQVTLGEEELLAKLAAKFNDDVASIWSDQRDLAREENATDDIWKMLPFYQRAENQPHNLEIVHCAPNSAAAEKGREFVWPGTDGIGDEAMDKKWKRDGLQKGNCKSFFASEPMMAGDEKWNNSSNRAMFSSFASLEIDCSSPESGNKAQNPASSNGKDDEMELIWEILGKALYTEHMEQASEEPVTGIDFKWQNHDRDAQFGGSLLDEKMIDLQMIWDPSTTVQRSLQYAHLGSTESLAGNDTWRAEEVETTSENYVPLTRSYDSYLNKIYANDEQSGKSEIEVLSEPTIFPINCTLTYHKGESRFVEVKPSCRNKWGNGERAKVPLQVDYPSKQLSFLESEMNKENLLTSPKTHFRPIRQDSSDTTASSEDSGLTNENTATATANQKTLSPLFLPFCPGEEESSDESGYIPQNCSLKTNEEKFCQTEDMLEKDDEEESGNEECSTRILNAVIDVLDSMVDEEEADDVAASSSLESNSSSSVSPPSSREEDPYCKPNPRVLFRHSTAFDDKTRMWNEVVAVPSSSSLPKWSTAPEDSDNTYWTKRTEPATSWQQLATRGSCDAPTSERDKIEALRDEIREESEKLFADINTVRVADLDEAFGSRRCQWMKSQCKGSAAGSKDPGCLHFKRLHTGLSDYNSSDGDDGTSATSINYSDYFGNLEGTDTFVASKMPSLPSNKVVYSADLEEEWKNSEERAFKNAHEIPKNRDRQKGSQLKRPCSFYMEGNCRRTDCKFSHDLASITCRFWVEGSCFKGVTCPFLHGFHSRDKRDIDEKADFKLELESEAHFPTLSKAKVCPRKKRFSYCQDLVQTSSSDSTPITKNKRYRKRFPGKERPITSSVWTSKHHAKGGGSQHQSQKNKHLSSKSSSSEDDLMDF